MQVEQAQLLNAVASLLPAIQEDAIDLDRAGEFPHKNFKHLIEAGLLIGTLPSAYGGKDFGYGAEGAISLLKLFMLLGEASLPVARLYEAHVNALQLIQRYGSLDMVERAARDVADNHLFALWVTDPLDGGVGLQCDADGLALSGGKAFCSGAGVATRALITADGVAGAQMLVVRLEPHTRVMPSKVKLGGMRAAITGSVDFSGMRIVNADLLGEPGDYLREPVFSAGAWRSAAAALGGLAALVKLHRAEILKRQRDADPYQRMRFGQVVMAYETARLWMEQAALRGCLEDDKPAAIVAYINLARLAVEASCLDAMQLSQRSLGLGAFMAGHRMELICRDLATYLRQPAPDEVLDKAAAFFFRANVPDIM